jgi:hypothetical protein
LVFVLSVPIVAIVGWVALSPNSPPASGDASPAPDWLVKAAADVASQNGDSSVTSAQWGTTDAASIAETAGNSGGDASQTEYVVILGGTFSNNKSFAPDGQTLSGDEILFTVDIKSEVIQDFEIGDAGQFDTSRLPKMFDFTGDVSSVASE